MEPFLNRHREIHARKMFRLTGRLSVATELLDPKQVVTNLSNYGLSDMEYAALAKVLEFSLVPKSINYCSFMGPFERLYRQLLPLPRNDNGNIEFFRTKLQNLARDSFSNVDCSRLQKNFTKEELICLKKLSRNKELLVVKPDKGSGVVVMNKCDYLAKIHTILAAESKFKGLQDDTLMKLRFQDSILCKIPLHS